MPRLPSAADFNRSTPSPNRPMTNLTIGQDTQAEAQSGQVLSSVGNAVSRIGNEFIRMQQQEQEKLDTLRAEDALNKLASKQQDLTYGDNGFLKLRGGDVVKRPVLDEFPQQLANETEAIAASLTTEQQKQLFRRKASDMQLRFKGDLLRHSLSESEKYADQVAEGTISRFETQATQQFSSNADIETARNGIAQTVRENLSGKGLDEDSINAAVAKQVSDLNSKIINARMLNGDQKGAMDFYRENKEGIDLKMRGTLENMLKEGATRNLAQETGDYVTSQNMNEQQALDYVRQKFSGEEETAAIQEVKVRFAEKATIKARTEKDISDSAWTTISNGGGVRQIPVDVWNALDGREKVSIQDYVYNRAERAKRNAEGKATKTDIQAYAGLRDAIVANPEISNTDLLKDRRFSLLSDSDQQEMIKYKDTLAKNPQKVKEVLSVNDQISGTLAPLGLKTDKKQVASMAIQQAIDDEALARGKDLNRDERQKVIDKMIMRGEVVSGKWYLPDSDARYFEVAGTPKASAFIPDDDVIVQRFEQKNGRKPTGQELKAIKDNLLKGK